MRQKTQAGPEDSSERKSRDAQDKKCIFKRQSCLFSGDLDTIIIHVCGSTEFQYCPEI